MLNTLLRRVAAVHHARALDVLEVHASDEPRALSGHRKAARVLLVGSGVTSGWGVQTHGLALVGSLQRELQSRLGRPVDVEQVDSLGASVAAAPAIIGDRAAEDWDAIVVTFGLSDAMCLTPVKDWAGGLGHLLAKLDADMPRGLLVPILIAGVPPMNSLGALRLLMPLRLLIGRHGERLNAATRSLIARNRRAAFVPLPGMANSSDRPTGSPEAYRVWAAVISDSLGALMPDVVRTDVELDMIDPAAGDLAAAVLAPRNAAIRSGLHEVVMEMAARYSADLVLLSLVRGDELLVVASSSGGDVQSMSRSSILSGETRRAGVLHVPDIAADPRFAGVDGLGRRGVASYAGLAVHDDDQGVIGSVGVVNGTTSGPIDTDVLHGFGAAIEARLAQLDTACAHEGATALPQVRDEPAATTHVRDEPAAPPHVPDSGAPHPTTSTLRSAAVPDGAKRRLRGLIGRQRRLEEEGRQLTEVAAARSVPTDTDLWVPGGDPLRVLVIGGEYSVGFGAGTRDEALDGVLARLLHTRTGRGVLVENRSQHQVRLRHLSASLGPSGAATFDLVVWTPTFIEGARLAFRSRWFAGIELLLRRIETTSDASVVLVGYPSLLGSQPLAVLARTRAAQINRLLRRIAARHAGVLVAEPPAIVLRHVESSDGPQVYRDAAVQIFPTVMDLIDLQRTGPRFARGRKAARPVAPSRELVDA